MARGACSRTTALTGSSTVTMVPHGMASPVTTLSVVATTPHLQVVVPMGTAAGSYDVTVQDSSSCPAVLASAITVTSTTTVTVSDVTPPFGWTNANTAIQIDRNTTAAAPNNVVFQAVPTVFLNPSSGSSTAPAIQLTATSFTDKNTLTSIVPSGQATGAYDLVVVNPDGSVGVLMNAFTVTANPPPTITTVAPLAVVDTTGQNVVISGTNLRGSPPTLSIPQCADATGAVIANPATIAASGNPTCDTSTPPQCTQNATINASGLATGTTCLVKLANPDGTYAVFSAVSVTNASLNTAMPRAGTQMTTGRRALAGAAANATSAARFVYAIGGDNGGSTVFKSVESAPVDLFGNMKSWSAQRYDLGTGSSFGAAAQVGRYIYLCGGTSTGSDFLKTCQRAMVLDPLEAPPLDINDIEVKSTGLGAGLWYYKVSATFGTSDPDNPGGESLPSDEVPVDIPTLSSGNLVQITLTWSAPKDSQGNPLPNVTGYNIYRTASANGTPGGEVLLTTVSATTLTFTDTGSNTPGMATPLPLGSTGQWASLPAMGTARKGLAMSYGFDPATPDTFYVYSFYGLSNATTASGSYEYLPVTVQANGHQTAGTAWTTGASSTTHLRWQVGAYHVDSSVFSKITSGTYIYVGSGVNAAGNMGDGTVEAGQVAAGGDLGTLTAQRSVNGTTAGYGAAAGADQLFTFGGDNAAPWNGSKSATLTTPQPGLASGAWNANPLNLVDSLYLPGVGVQSSFVFLLGGETATTPSIVVTKDTEILTF